MSSGCSDLDADDFVADVPNNDARSQLIHEQSSHLNSAVSVESDTVSQVLLMRTDTKSETPSLSNQQSLDIEASLPFLNRRGSEDMCGAVPASLYKKDIIVSNSNPAMKSKDKEAIAVQQLCSKLSECERQVSSSLSGLCSKENVAHSCSDSTQYKTPHPTDEPSGGNIDNFQICAGKGIDNSNVQSSSTQLMTTLRREMSSKTLRNISDGIESKENCPPFDYVQPSYSDRKKIGLTLGRKDRSIPSLGGDLVEALSIGDYPVAARTSGVYPVAALTSRVYPVAAQTSGVYPVATPTSGDYPVAVPSSGDYPVAAPSFGDYPVAAPSSRCYSVSSLVLEDFPVASNVNVKELDNRRLLDGECYSRANEVYLKPSIKSNEVGDLKRSLYDLGDAKRMKLTPTINCSEIEADESYHFEIQTHEENNDPVEKSLSQSNIVSADDISHKLSEAEIQFDELINRMSKDVKHSKRLFSSSGGYKISESFWKDIDPVDGPVPYGHSGTAIFKMELNCKKKLADIEEVRDGYTWKRQVTIKSNFEGCSNHTRYC